jgi:hypothetical protein
MNESVKNPFDAMLDAFRQIVRDELKAGGNGNGHAAGDDEHARTLAAAKMAVAAGAPFRRAIGRHASGSQGDGVRTGKEKNHSVPSGRTVCAVRFSRSVGESEKEKQQPFLT